VQTKKYQDKEEKPEVVDIGTFPISPLEMNTTHRAWASTKIDDSLSFGVNGS